MLGGDHVYKMDYTALLAEHVANEADVTVACVDVPIEQASEFGIMQIDERDRVLRFDEKPRSGAANGAVRAPRVCPFV